MYSNLLKSLIVAILISVSITSHSKSNESAANKSAANKTVANKTVANQTVGLASFDKQVASLVNRLSASIVTIETVSPARGHLMAKTGAQPVFVNRGSATIIDSSGLLICSAALVAGEDSISLIRDGIHYPVRIVGIDYRTGLALLRAILPNAIPVRMAPEPGQTSSMTLILGRSENGAIEASLGICNGSFGQGRLIFSGSVGSSGIGGGVFDLSGDLLGMTLGSLIDKRNQSRGLALPVSRITAICSRLRCCGDRQAGYLGVKTIDTKIIGITRRSLAPNIVGMTPGLVSNANALSQDYATPGNLIRASITAPLIVSVDPGSPAELADLQAGDVIYSCDGVTMNSVERLRDFVVGCRPDSVVRFSVLRGDSRISRDVRIVAAPLAQFEPGLSNALEPPLLYDSGPSADSLLMIIESMEYRLRMLEKKLSPKEE
ncbi:MAG: serine protease [candidate division Zixibacteria bacterium]|nr:serine protease [candidate division Zixibacteria bacterium]